MPFPDPKTLLDEAARCVACGLCLPHCPTYRKTLSEADSPRGRIALIQAGLSGKIPINPRFYAHLDLCLGCRACEAACPNQVAYGSLIAGVRSLTEPARPRSLWQRLARRALVDGLATHPARLRVAGGLLRLWQGSGVPGLIRRSALLTRSRLAKLALNFPVIDAQPHWKKIYPATGKVRGEVGFFLGCVARLADSETLRASIFVLNRLGYTVHVPQAQACCGAMHTGMGESAKAAIFRQKNLDAFRGLDAIISTATGCGATLKEYPAEFADRVKDISEFLSGAEGWPEVALAPLSQTVAVHEQCLMRNALHCEDKPYDLLRRIPGLIVEPLAGNDQCCGAAGSYFLTQPAMSSSLLADKIAALGVSNARILATSNVGCALHLASGLKAAGIEIEVMHTVTLVARQMGFDDVENR